MGNRIYSLFVREERRKEEIMEGERNADIQNYEYNDKRSTRNY